jgi:hypothetical protein
LLPGLAEVLRAFEVEDPWTRLVVFLNPDGRLGGKAPLDAILEGDIPRATEAVASYGEQVAD